MQAMVLAAGFGTRLKPYSLVKPKPLFPVLNKPLLIATLDRLRNAGFSKKIVNAHYLKNHFLEILEEVSDVIVQEEDEVLGTGGGLRLAQQFFSDEPVLVTNGDVYHTIDYSSVYRSHIESGCSVTMVLHDYPRFNTVTIEGDQVKGFRQNGPNRYAYTGIQVITPEILTDIPLGKNYCIINYYNSLLQKGVEINGLVLENTNWTDMGTPGDYLALHEVLLREKIPVWPELGKISTSSVAIDSRAFLGSESRVEEWGCIGKARVGKGSTIKRSVIWDGAVIPAGTCLSDSIIIPD